MKVNSNDLNKFINPIQPKVINSVLFSPKNLSSKLDSRPTIDFESVKNNQIFSLNNQNILNQL